MDGITTDRAILAVPVELPGVMGKLEATRRELVRHQRWLKLARLLLAEIMLFSAFVFADWMWVLPVALRGFGVLAICGLGAVLLLRSRRSIDRAAAAASVETHFPELGQRVRTVVEYAEPAPDTVPASPGLIDALGRDTDSRTSGLEFRELVPWASFWRQAAAFSLACAVGITALCFSPGLRTATLRMLLFPLHYTALAVKPGDVTLKAGEDLKLEISLSGRPVHSASWSIRKKGAAGPWMTTSFAADRTIDKAKEPLIGALSASLKDCQADLDYRVAAGEVESPIYHVRVLHPLLIEAIEATVTPPPYTRRPAEVVKEGSFRAIEGSRVQIAIMLDRVPQTAALVWGSAGESSRRSIVLKRGGARLTAALPPITREIQYEIAAADADGMKLETEIYRVKVQADLKPTIRFIRPEESLAVTPTTEVPIQVEAGDDFGVTRLGINFKVGDGPEETLHLAGFENQPVTALGLATLYLEKHKLSFTDAITYYAFVEDNYPAKPHRVVTELRYIDILPYKQAYELVAGGGTCNGASVSLEELIARQRVNLNRTFAFESDQTVGEETARRLARNEQELTVATAEFADGMTAIAGPVPALDEAVAAMRSATELLTAKDLRAARPKEEAALKGLTSARQNLRKLLLQSQSSQASACRSYDVKQLQRIRRPPADPKKEQLARLENDLQELAKREQKFSEEIEAKGRGGPQLDPLPVDKSQAQNNRKPSEKPSSRRPGSRSQGSGNQTSQARLTPAQQQRQAAEEAARLRQLARQDEVLTDLTNRRLDAASLSVQESSRSIEAGREAEAALGARMAARKLESVARQVGALKARELTDRLARSRDLAAAIASAERELGRALERKAETKDAGAPDERRLAETQRELADEVAALADVLRQLKMAAAEEQPELAESIGRAARANPPEEVKESMRQNAAAIGEGRSIPAARSADHAAGQLDALAADLESVRRAAIEPQLERLLAAEKQAAELEERLRSVRQSSQTAEAEKAIFDLARLLDNLATGDGPLRKAADKLSAATQPGVGGWTRNDRIEPGHAGYFVPPTAYTGGLSAVSLALQAKIQEIVLDNALVERNGPVPPQYKNLVEDYYRVLSQDLR
ncbi:MAG: DUF4175 family protein [Isosphaeraceae bacterium]